MCVSRSFKRLFLTHVLSLETPTISSPLFVLCSQTSSSLAMTNISPPEFTMSISLVPLSGSPHSIQKSTRVAYGGASRKSLRSHPHLGNERVPLLSVGPFPFVRSS